MLSQPVVVKAMFNSFVISSLATVLSLGVTVTSGYMLSRFKGPIPNTWFSLIYVFRCVPYVSWVLPLYYVTLKLGIFDTYWGCSGARRFTCFFSWILRVFRRDRPSMEYAAMIGGAPLGAFLRVARVLVAMPHALAIRVALPWNEFLFA